METDRWVWARLCTLWDFFTDQKRDNASNRHRKTDFAMGIINGFQSKPKLQRSQDRRLVDESPGTRALIRHGAPQLERYFRHRYPCVRTIQRGSARQAPEVYNDGVEAGEKLVMSKGVAQMGGRLPYRKR